MSPVLPGDIVTRIKEETDIVSVVREYVSLKPSGSSFKGCCPFHKEKTPSFHVNIQQQYYKCFGCGEGGDVISFLMNLQGLSFPESLEVLARPLNIDLAKYLTDNDESEGERQAWFRALETASEAWVEELWSDSGKEAKAYLIDRGFSEEVLRRYDVGFAPEGSQWLGQKLKANGVSLDLAVRTGLLMQGDYDKPFTYFRNRIIFPVRNIAQRIAGFGGRIIGPGEPKYLNSRESNYFNKRALLYGFSVSRIPIARSKKAILVEGYLDLLALVQHGFNNCVATCGTAFTVEQAQALHRGCRTLYVLYDGDKAGLKASIRAASVALQAGLEPKIAMLPDNLDPDDFLQENSPEALGELLHNSLGYMELLHDLAVKSGKGREGLERAIRASVDTISGVNDPIRQSLLIDEASTVFGLERAIIVSEIERLNISANRRYKGQNEDTETESESPKKTTGGHIVVDIGALEKSLLSCAINDSTGKAVKAMNESLVDHSFASSEASLLAEEFQKWEQESELEPGNFVRDRWYNYPDSYRNFVTSLLALDNSSSVDDVTSLIADCVTRIQREKDRLSAIAKLRNMSGLKSHSSQKVSE
jgi:DNA primase